MGWGPGARVGAYEIVAPIGNGGMGEVYKVRHTISQRIEAMKVLLSGAARRPEVNDRFVREIRVLANLNHPNIATLHTAFHHEDQLIMVMEFVEGKNLSECLARGLVLRDAVQYIRQVLTALSYAHSQGVIHRDIKPSNVMINATGQVKLLDFGLALMSTPDPRLTSSGSLLGSVHYISPEQIRGETMDARSDLYAVGVTLYEVTTGRLPIPGNAFSEIINGHLSLVPPAPHTINRSIPDALSAITMRALAKQPSERFQSATEFLQALDAVKLGSDMNFEVTMETPFSMPVTPVATSGPAAAAQSRSYDPAVLNDITAQLANYVGPIAKVIVKRASSSSNNLRELCDKLAREIDSEKSRQNFLLNVRKHIGSGDRLL